MEIENDSFLNGNLLEFFMQIKVNVCLGSRSTCFLVPQYYRTAHHTDKSCAVKPFIAYNPAHNEGSCDVSMNLQVQSVKIAKVSRGNHTFKKVSSLLIYNIVSRYLIFSVRSSFYRELRILLSLFVSHSFTCSNHHHS